MSIKRFVFVSSFLVFSCAGQSQPPSQPQAQIEVQNAIDDARLENTPRAVAPVTQATTTAQAGNVPVQPTEEVASEVASQPSPPVQQSAQIQAPAPLSPEAQEFQRKWKASFKMIEEAFECVISTGTNNLLFTKKCVPLTKGREYMLRLKKLEATYDGIKFETENVLHPTREGETKIKVLSECTVPVPRNKRKKKRLMDKLMKITNREFVLFRAGPTQRISSRPGYKKKSLEIHMKPCKFLRVVPFPEELHGHPDFADMRQK